MLINLVALLWTPIAIVLGLIPIILLLPTVILVKLPLRRRLKLVIPVWKFFGWFVMRVCFLSRIQHIDNRSKDSRLNTLQSGLYICNHLSYADVPMTLIFFQIPTVMKKEVLYIPLIGQLARASGSMPFDRSTGDSRKQIFELCKTRLLDNLPVQYYPEGTRNKNTPKSPKGYEHIKTPLLRFAFEKKIPVTAVSLVNTEKVFNKYGLIVPFQKVGIYIHAPVIGDTEKMTAEDFAKESWKKVQTGYAMMENYLKQGN